MTAHGVQLPTLATLQKVASIPSGKKAVDAFIARLVSCFPGELPAADFTSETTRAARMLLLASGCTLRAREDKGVLCFRIVSAERRPTEGAAA